MACKDDDKAFIFTLKNPHGVEPTRFMKRKASDSAIYCHPKSGPSFGYDNHKCDIFIDTNSNMINCCYIGNDGTKGYECHPKYKSSLFVNGNQYGGLSTFRVLEYEVFGIDNFKDYIFNTCKYPNIIMEYIDTKDISEESLKKVENGEELRNDLKISHCNDMNILLKISKFFFKNPSELLANTQIVGQQYDKYLKQWCGDYKWKLLFRATENKNIAKSFHECCDDKGPTLLIIKSTDGWIFGGYTTQSWDGKGII